MLPFGQKTGDMNDIWGIPKRLNQDGGQSEMGG
jgi:hypothetical protein